MPIMLIIKPFIGHYKWKIQYFISVIIKLELQKGTESSRKIKDFGHDQ